MLLVVDVGNTNTVFGVYRFDARSAAPESEPAELLASWRVETRKGRTSDEYAAALHSFFSLAGMRLREIQAAIIGTVVPPVLFALEDLCRRHLNVTAQVVGSGLRTGMAILTENPREVGADRIVNAVAAFERVRGACIVVDFGTATTFDAVDATGTYVGGAIAPGLQISADALFSRTSRLPRVEIQAPARAIGTNTVAAMQSGLFWGYVGLVDGLAARCKAELGGAAVPCVATGGLANLVGRACREIDEVDEHLTLHGLRIWFERG